MGTKIVEAQLPAGIDHGEQGENERTVVMDALKSIGVKTYLNGTIIQMEVSEELLPRVKQTIELSRANITGIIDKNDIDMEEEL